MVNDDDDHPYNITYSFNIICTRPKRPLFGGAIASTFPVRFQVCTYVSNVRQVPDHQDVADNGSATWFLQDLANEQDVRDNHNQLLSLEVLCLL
nr:probable ran guanine nucleotide release factor [Ipomoea batatas]